MCTGWHQGKYRNDSLVPTSSCDPSHRYISCPESAWPTPASVSVTLFLSFFTCGRNSVDFQESKLNLCSFLQSQIASDDNICASKRGNKIGNTHQTTPVMHSCSGTSTSSHANQSQAGYVSRSSIFSKVRTASRQRVHTELSLIGCATAPSCTNPVLINIPPTYPAA